METDPVKMDTLSKGAFAPIYPLIASQITEQIGIKTGICVDVGTGPASLSIALAKTTDLKIYAMDIKADMCKIAEENIDQEDLSERIVTVRGDVHYLPFPNYSADLVVSRGSIPFWKDLEVAFSEIYRILKPCGAAYIGGGFGNRGLKEKIKKELNKDNRKFENENLEIPPKIDIDTLEIAVKKVNVDNYRIINDESGLWVIIRKYID